MGLAIRGTAAAAFLTLSSCSAANEPQTVFDNQEMAFDRVKALGPDWENPIEVRRYVFNGLSVTQMIYSSDNGTASASVGEDADGIIRKIGIGIPAKDGACTQIDYDSFTKEILKASQPEIEGFDRHAGNLAHAAKMMWSEYWAANMPIISIGSTRYEFTNLRHSCRLDIYRHYSDEESWPKVIDKHCDGRPCPMEIEPLVGQGDSMQP